MTRTRIKIRRCMVSTCEKDHIRFPNLKLFALPRPGELREAWLQAIGRNDLRANLIAYRTTHFKVCEEHFEPSDIIRDMFGELLGQQARKILKPDAVPKLLLPSSETKEEAGDETRVNGNDWEGATGSDIQCKPDDVSPARPAKIRSKVKTKKRQRVPAIGCLICRSPPAKNYTRKFCHPGANNMDSLNMQLWHIFVLEKILKVSSLKCQDLLTQFGMKYQPESWFHLCSPCSSDTAKAMEICQEIMALELKLRTVVRRLSQKTKTSVEEEIDGYSVPVLQRNEVETELWSWLKLKYSKNPEISENVAQTQASSLFMVEKLNYNETVATDASVKDEPMDDDNDYEPANDFGFAPVSMSECTAGDPKERSKQILAQEDLAARIERLLEQNAAIVGEPLLRPPGFTFGDSDSDSYDDTAPAREKVLKPKRKRVRLIVPPSAPPIFSDNHDKTVTVLSKISDERNNHAKAQDSSNDIQTFANFIVKKNPRSTKLKCQACPAVFFTLRMLKKHESVHKVSTEMDSIFDCKACGMAIEKDVLREQHIRIRHLGHTDKDENRTRSPSHEFEFPMEECDEEDKEGTFINKKEESQGTKNMTSVKRKQPDIIDCPFCAAQFCDMQDYESHLNLHEQIANNPDLNCFYPCCCYPFNSKNRLVTHLRKAHGETVENKVCEVCNIKIPAILQKTWRLHMLKHTLEETRKSDSGDFGCPLCEKEFHTMRALIRHKKQDHPGIIGMESFLCDHCPRILLTEGALKNHVATYHGNGDNNVQCETCGKVFNSQKKLQEHIHQVHEGKKYACDRCGGEFTTRTNLREHKLKFYGEDLTSLEKHLSFSISKRYTTKPHLRKPHSCNRCNEVFPHFSAWKRHLKVHATEKCGECGSTFLNRGDLLKHELIHKSGESKNCQYCGKEFKSRIRMYSHYAYCSEYKKLKNETVTGSIKCSKCKRSFKHSRSFGGHLPSCKRTAEEGESVSVVLEAN